MKKFIVFSMVLFSGTVAFAQVKIERSWGKKGYDAAFCAAATNDGGYIIGGLTQSQEDTVGDIIVIKTTSHIDTMWTLKYGGSRLEGANSIIQTADGGFMVSGHTEDFGARDCDAFMMKLDKNGNREWFKVYGGDYDDISEGVIELPTGEYVIAGITASYGPGNGAIRHTYFIKTNSRGDTIWTRWYGGTKKDYGYSIASMVNGGFFAVGFSSSWGQGEDDAWLLQLKDNGDTLRTRLYKNGGNSRFLQIISTIDKGYIIAGYTSTAISGTLQGWAVKLDANGNQLWEKTYGSPAYNSTFSGVTQLPNGNLIFAGTSDQVDSTGNASIVTTDANGTLISNSVYGGSHSYARCIASQGNNSYLAAGLTDQAGDQAGDLYYLEMDNTLSAIAQAHPESPYMYPNPVKDQLHILLAPSQAGSANRIDIINIHGQIVLSKQPAAASIITINVKDLIIGTYTFRIFSPDGKMTTGKFIKE
ncbi:MAG: T9SS type A sorting domain-containing protein [Taibaiella sp.]|nr:T9SS type A sorting domain-containing protein [Taibaiella sp.]